MGKEKFVISFEDRVKDSLEKVICEFLDGEFVFLFKIDIFEN